MQIKYDDRIRNKYSKGLSRGSTKVTTIVLHGTAGPGTIRYMLNVVKRAYRYKKAIGLFHYYIKRDGTIINLIDPKNWTYHSHSNKRDKKTIGIELANSNFKNQGEYTDDQYSSLALLCQHLLKNFPHITEIVSHDFMYKKYVKKWPKSPRCPGEAFDSYLFKYYLSSLIGLDFKFDQEWGRYWDIKMS